MNLLEFENERFGDVWNEEMIREFQSVEVNKKQDCHDLIGLAMTNDELYREFQEVNWNEYFDPAGTYKYCIWR